VLDDNARAGGRLRQAIDDNSLTPVPENERKSGWYLSWLPAGVATSLLQLTIAGTITALVGSVMGLVAGAIVGIFVMALGWLFGNIARTEGLSSTVLPRFYGLGLRGGISMYFRDPDGARQELIRQELGMVHGRPLG
jgi:cytosine permease